MNALEQAREFFNAKADDLRLFDEEDPFNGHQLEGYICRISDHRYGALFLTKINGVPYRPQVIYGTPKLKYPFDRSGRFHWPKCKKVIAYDKYDGTNICGWSYEYKKKRYVTYKTRLMPILRAGKFGDFLSMWREMLERYPEIPNLVLESGHNISFELFGARNKHLIVYDEPLDTRLLFGIRRGLEPSIVDPEVYADGPAPIADGEILKNPKDLTSFYKKLQAEAEATNQTTDFGIEGTEGYVLYLHCEDGRIEQIKLKPATIEKIAWAAGGLNKNSIRTTCINAFENHDEVTIEILKELLKEEFEERQIEAYHYRIEEVLSEVTTEMEFRFQILETYDDLDLDLFGDKRGTMRAMSGHFPRSKMGYVYWVLAKSVL